MVKPVKAASKSRFSFCQKSEFRGIVTNRLCRLSRRYTAVGKLLGNLLMSWFAQPGHERTAGERADYRRWILGTVQDVWTGFDRKFRALWAERRTGDAYPEALLPTGSPAFARAQERFMAGVWRDAVGYGGCAMIRRTLGLAHNADMETIADPERRAARERLNLLMAIELVRDADRFPDIAAVTARAVALDSAA